jgi:glycosyltransferase involved in cell wall biosynthesis
LGVSIAPAIPLGREGGRIAPSKSGKGKMRGKSAMRFLLVGKRAGQSGVSEGPVSAFESLAAGFYAGGEEVRIFPDRPRVRLLTYISLLFLSFRRWDVINAHLTANFGVLLGVLMPRSKRTVLTIHGYNPIESAWHPYNAFMHRLQVRYLFQNRIYVSSLIRQRVEALEGLSGGVVIPNAVRQLSDAESPEGGVKDVDVFSLCGYSFTKGSSVLLEAIVAISQPLSIVLAGHGERGDQCGRPLHHSLQCLGPLTAKEINALFFRSRVYVQPSLYESFGIPVVEALLAGIPTVVSTGSGVAEFLTDGVDALLVPPGDSQALARAIRYLLEHEEVALRLSCEGKVTAQRFAPESIAQQYRDYFAGLRMQHRKRG